MLNLKLKVSSILSVKVEVGVVYHLFGSTINLSEILSVLKYLRNFIVVKELIDLCSALKLIKWFPLFLLIKYHHDQESGLASVLGIYEKGKGRCSSYLLVLY